MKYLPTIFLLTMMLSCSKDKHTAVDPGRWTVLRTGNARYDLKVKEVKRSVGENYKILTAVSDEQAATRKSISILFNEFPVTSGFYYPVDFLNDRLMGPDQVRILLAFPGRDTLYSTGLAHFGPPHEWADSITVNVKDGKISVVIPSMTSYTEPMISIDSAVFYGSLSEQ